ncbi:unnamed protein product, partial [Mesorhabditis belari]|uniref:Uncharacterized protein n=1 Tax=Mesorhabditis belari TaxID=2138241 RepID=A0AAF3J9T9_9BILA
MTSTVDKKIMAEKIAKVKEVVRGINQNDIVLALHSFDLDVEKTIQGLCENRSAVLDEWVCSGAAKKQKNKASKKKASDNDSVTTETPSVSSKSETIIPTIALTSNAKKPLAQANGYHPTNAKQNGMGEMEWLSSHEKEATKIATAFSQECKRGLEEIQSTFKALRQALADREKILVLSLNRSQQDAEKLINENKNTAMSLLTRMRAVRGDPALNGDLKAFGQARRSEQQLASASAFTYDMTYLIDALNKFGSVAEVVPSRGGSQVSTFSTTSPSPIRHAASHSSIISDHDSGLGGHISPVSIEEKKQNVVSKPIAHLNAGGFQMASDGLSAEQLEQLQKIMQAQLAASGIDASVVAGGGGTGIVPARPRGDRRPNNNNANKNHGGGGPGRKANGGPKKNEKMPEISILG